MSRAALWKADQLRATQPVLAAPPPPEALPSGALPIHGNQTTYNVNTLLANNIMGCDYFRALYPLQTYHEVIDEVYNKVTHVEPWATGTSRLPSTAFCLLFKFFTMRLTKKQVTGLLTHSDSPYIRAIGFLYLRYACDPKQIWDWYAPYLDDSEEFAPSSDPNALTTLGLWLRGLLSDLHYYGTMLPRIPVPIERKIKMRLVLVDEKKKRAAGNRRQMGAFRAGARVKAIYEDAENDPAWYGAVISEVYEAEEGEEETYLVTFEGYGNQEVVGLGDMMLQDGGSARTSRDVGGQRDASADRRRSRSRSNGRSRSRERRRSRSRSRSFDRGRRSDRDSARDGERRERGRKGRGGEGESLLGRELLEEVRRKEREAAAARGKEYGQRPATFKGSLSLKVDTYSHRSKTTSHGGDRRRSRSRSYESRPRHGARQKQSPPMSKDRDEDRRERRQIAPKPESQKLKALKAFYGDASAQRQDD